MEGAVSEQVPWLVAAPEVVYVPSRPVRPGDEEAQLELRRAEGGGVVLLAYSSPEVLVHALGPEQAWVALRAETVDGLVPGLGVTAVLLDHAVVAQQ